MGSAGGNGTAIVRKHCPTRKRKTPSEQAPMQHIGYWRCTQIFIGDGMVVLQAIGR